MRKETSNQFTDGLVSDLNPIITPNTVLTDALNGTIITYNGNEHSLQNDMGNYELKHCKLNPNYIPVGVKEYGDILYVVSYNPIDKLVEVGSYPSPLQYNEPDERDNPNNEINSIIEQVVNSESKEGDYKTLMENSDSIIFNGDDYKLNPGDQYCLQIEESKNTYKYETLEYTVLDENTIVHNVSDKIKVDDTLEYQDYTYIPWTIPGWLCAKMRLAELSVAGINVRQFYVKPSNDDKKIASFSFNLRLNIKDPYLIDDKNHQSILNDWCSKIESSNQVALYDVRFRIAIEKQNENGWESVWKEGDTVIEYQEFAITDTESTLLNLNQQGWTEWYDKCKIIWKNISGNIIDLNSNDIIRVRMTPVLAEENKYRIVYSNLEQLLIFDLNNIDDVDWGIGNTHYKFNVSDDGKQQLVHTNISGPLVASTSVGLYIELYDINNKVILEEYKYGGSYGIGDVDLVFNFANEFQKENIYAIKLILKDIDENEIFSTKRFLITSEIFNSYMNTDKTMFDRDISWNEWLDKYFDKTVNLDVKYINHTIIKSEFIQNSKNTSDDDKFFGKDKYSTFFTKNNNLSEIVMRDYNNYDVTCKLENKGVFIVGDLWSAIKPCTNYYNVFEGHDLKIDLADKYPLKSKCWEDYYYCYNKGNSFRFGKHSTKLLGNEKITIKVGDKKIKDYPYNFYVSIYFEVGYENHKLRINFHHYLNGKWEHYYEYSREDFTGGSAVNFSIPDFIKERLLGKWYAIPLVVTSVRNAKGDDDGKAQPITNKVLAKTINNDFVFIQSGDDLERSNLYMFMNELPWTFQSDFLLNQAFPVIPLVPNTTDIKPFKKLFQHLVDVKFDSSFEVYNNYTLKYSRSENNKDLTTYIKLNSYFTKDSLYYDNEILLGKSRGMICSRLGVLYNKILDPNINYNDFSKSDTRLFTLKENVYSPNPSKKLEFDSKIQNINSNGNSEYQNWINSYIYENYSDMKKYTGCYDGIYSDKIDISNDLFFQDLNKHYIEGIFGVTIEDVKNPTILDVLKIEVWWMHTDDVGFCYGQPWTINPAIQLDKHWPWILDEN